MPKILILNADDVETVLEVPRARFVFIMNDDGRVYHTDLTDGNMWQAKEDWSNLGDGHKKALALAKNDIYVK